MGGPAQKLIAAAFLLVVTAFAQKFVVPMDAESSDTSEGAFGFRNVSFDGRGFRAIITNCTDSGWVNPKFTVRTWKKGSAEPDGFGVSVPSVLPLGEEREVQSFAPLEVDEYVILFSGGIPKNLSPTYPSTGVCKEVNAIRVQEIRKAAAQAAKERAARAAREAERKKKQAEEAAKIAVACREVFRNTADKKVKDLTVREETQVRACQALRLYPPE